MKIPSVLFLFCLAAIAVLAEALPETEANLVLERASILKKAFDTGDDDTILSMTHPAVARLAGGEEALADLMRGAMKQLRDLDLEIVESTLRKPTDTIVVGDQKICFVTHITIMRIGDNRGRSVGFLIAARPTNGGEWRFIDGSGLRKDPTLINQLFPGFPKDYPFPENRVEKL